MNISIQLNKRHQVTSKGFTLVELLVVITIIAVLALLSTVGVSRMRSAARGATCSSNLRQISAAILSYASDNNGLLPPLEIRDENNKQSGVWTSSLSNDGYLPQVINKQGKLSRGDGVWACPDCTDPRGTGQPEIAFNGYGVVENTLFQKSNLVSFVNAREGRGDTYGSLRLSQIPYPERTWLVGDAASLASNLKTGWYAIRAIPSNWGANTPAARHSKKVNVCMVDGHMESLTVNQLKAPDKNYTMYK